MVHRLAPLVFAAALVGCGTDGQSVGTAVLLHVYFASDVPEATIEQGRRMEIQASGAETFDTNVTLGGQLNNHATATIRYKPGVTKGTLTFDVTVTDGGGVPIGRGSAQATLQANREASATVVLESAMIVGDMSHPDLARDLSMNDLTELPDLTPPPDLSMNDLSETPDLSAPDLSMPDLSMPDLSMPDLSMPDLSMPDLSMPDLSMPDLSMPDLSMPDLSMPDLAMPDMTVVDMAVCQGDQQCGNNRFCAGNGACLPRLSGGGNCTGEGDHACLSFNCVANSKCSSCPKGMQSVAAGTYTLGSTAQDANTQADEQPQHATTLSAFCVDTTEVKVSDYRACVTAGACALPNFVNTDNVNCNYTVAMGANENRPVSCIDWGKAKAFCEWVGNGSVHALGARRLPTEAEWEAHARGNDKRAYPWGNAANDCNHSNHDPTTNGGAGSCSGGDPRAFNVGSLSPTGDSASGTRDASGNVFEWTADWYSNTYYTAACLNGCTNPTGPMAGTERVLRGGSWTNGPTRFTRCASRTADNPANGFTNVGVRCVGPAF